MPGELTLPHTWRPYGARLVGTLLGAMLLVLVAAVWIAWGADVRSSFTFGQRASASAPRVQNSKPDAITAATCTSRICR